MAPITLAKRNYFHLILLILCLFFHFSTSAVLRNFNFKPLLFT